MFMVIFLKYPAAYNLPPLVSTNIHPYRSLLVWNQLYLRQLLRGHVKNGARGGAGIIQGRWFPNLVYIGLRNRQTDGQTNWVKSADIQTDCSATGSVATKLTQDIILISSHCWRAAYGLRGRYNCHVQSNYSSVQCLFVSLSKLAFSIITNRQMTRTQSTHFQIRLMQCHLTDNYASSRRRYKLYINLITELMNWRACVRGKSKRNGCFVCSFHKCTKQSH